MIGFKGEFIVSNARMTLHKWTHIAVVRFEKTIRLYVNGILDAVNITSGYSRPNTGVFYIGHP